MDETQYSQLAGLLGIDPEKLRQQQQTQGLLSAGLNILSAAGPSRTPTSLGQIVSAGGMAGLQAYQEAGQRAIDVGVQGLKIAEIKKKFEDERKVRELSTNLYTPEGTINQNALRQLSVIAPDRAKSLIDIQAGQTETTTIYDTNTGKEVKVRLNKLTGDYTQIGGTKAEDLIQVDAGDRIEFRNKTSGMLVGSTLKGATPTAPSFTLTDAGILNTKTGQIQPLPEGVGRKASEGEQKQITGVQNTRNAITEFRNELNNFSRLDSLKPKDRARIETKYRNMLMQAKEAYNLGVLNGPDLTILEQIIYNPTTVKGMVIGKEGIDAQASELDRIMANIKTTVQTRGAPLPTPAQPPAPTPKQNEVPVPSAPPAGVSQELWNVMTPEEKKLWRK